MISPQADIRLIPQQGEYNQVILPPTLSRIKDSFTEQELSHIVSKEPCNLRAVMAYASKLMDRGEIEKACEVRFAGCQRALEVLPEDEDIALDWDHSDQNRAFVEIVFSSATDYFHVGDWDFAAGLFETVLMLDEQDHSGASFPLAACYIALEEWELWEEIRIDISSSPLDLALLDAWAEYRREPNAGIRVNLRKQHPELYAEFTMQDHPMDETFQAEISGDRSLRRAQCRELWLRTEHIWTAFDDFTVFLSKR